MRAKGEFGRWDGMRVGEGEEEGLWVRGVGIGGIPRTRRETTKNISFFGLNYRQRWSFVVAGMMKCFTRKTISF